MARARTPHLLQLQLQLQLVTLQPYHPANPAGEDAQFTTWKKAYSAYAMAKACASGDSAYQRAHYLGGFWDGTDQDLEEHNCTDDEVEEARNFMVRVLLTHNVVAAADWTFNTLCRELCGVGGETANVGEGGCQRQQRLVQ